MIETILLTQVTNHMKLTFCCLPACLLMTSQLFAQQVELPIWEDVPPGEIVEFPVDVIADLRASSDLEHIRYVETPSLTLYPADEKLANGCCVIVCPGGGYNVLAWKKEGLEVAEWFNSIGVSAVVLKYRVPRLSKSQFHLKPLQDAQRAIRVVRQHAKDWKIDPARVGVLGFSAGGHLTLMTGMHFAENSYEPQDDIDKLSARPDFICPIYAAYQGVEYADNGPLGDLIKVTKETPPTFLGVTAKDSGRGVHAAQLFVELHKAGVPAELHIYEHGGHGYGLRPSQDPVSTWNVRLGEWLKRRGLLEKS